MVQSGEIKGKKKSEYSILQRNPHTIPSVCVTSSGLSGRWTSLSIISMCAVLVAPHIVSGAICHRPRPLPCLVEVFDVFFGLHSIKSDIICVEVDYKTWQRQVYMARALTITTTQSFFPPYIIWTSCFKKWFTSTQTHKHCGKQEVFSIFVTVAGSTYLWASCSIVSGHDRNNSLLSFCQHGAEKH